TALLEVKDLAIDLSFREGLRLEQMVAKLETLPVTMDVSQFYQLAKHPTARILADHPWLKLPKGASLEGFLAPATYHVLPDITPEQLIDKMLEAFYQQVGPERMDVPASRGMSFYEVVTLASLVEREPVVDSERRLMPRPICTPTAASIDAALHPNTKTGYLFFLAKHDGTNTHAFAKTKAEHDANLKKYGYL